MTISKIIDAIRQAERAILLGLCKQNEIQFSAPWAPRRNRCSGL
jgi:hypothetical protein